MAESINAVARLAGVSSRTLRHYDDIGLLTPAYVGGNGYRFYEQEQLLRLQRLLLLLLRELGLGLGAIGEILDGQRDQVEALSRHHAWLRSEQDRLRRLADSVSRTITHLQEGTTMTTSELFDGFADRTRQLESDLVEHHGEGVREHFDRSRP